MTETERCLAYFHRYQALILERLTINQPPETLTDDDRVKLAGQYLSLVSE
jgi:hypothetical protein